MTCREKFYKKHAGMRKDYAEKMLRDSCPDDFGYLGDPEYCIGTDVYGDCTKCWDREIPEETIKPRYALTDNELKKFFGHPDPVGEPGEPGEPGLKIKIAYLCDKTACQNCSYPMCSHTTDITHAKNFKKMPITDKDNCVRYFEEETE